MSYRPDDYDLERSHELERRLDRDAEREPYALRPRRPRFRPRYDAGVTLAPAANRNHAVAEQREAA
jgi:hypothetical protein